MLVELDIVVIDDGLSESVGDGCLAGVEGVEEINSLCCTTIGPELVGRSEIQIRWTMKVGRDGVVALQGSKLQVDG